MTHSSLIPTHVVEIVAITLFHFLWQGAVVAATLAMVLHAERRRSSNSRYLAAVSGLLLMTMCPIVTAALISRVSDLSTGDEHRISRIGAASDGPSNMHSAEPETNTNPRSVVESLPHPPDRLLAAVHRGAPWIFVSWMCGTVLLLIRIFGGWLLAHRMTLRAIEPHSPSLDHAFARLAARMCVARPPRLIVSAAAASPVLLGVYRTVIVLPVGLLSALSPQMVEAILAHELAHVRRHDYLINIVQCFVETLLFFHPAVWWISNRIREERETCCDDLVIATLNDRKNYARALAGLEILRAQPLTIAANGGALFARIQRILGANVMEKDNHSLIAPAAAALALAAVCGAVCIQAETRGSNISSSGSLRQKTSVDGRLEDSGAPQNSNSGKAAARSTEGNTRKVLGMVSPSLGPGSADYRVELRFTRSVVDAAGKHTETVLPGPTMQTLYLIPQRIAVTGGSRSFKFDLTARWRDNLLHPVLHTVVPMAKYHQLSSADYTRIVRFRKKECIIGATTSGDPTTRKRVLAGELVTDRGAHIAYYLHVKPMKNER